MANKNNLFLKIFFVAFALILFVSSAVAIKVSLGWNPNTEASLAGYNVYWGTSSRVYPNVAYVSAPSTTYTTGDLTPGQIYYFAVTAKNNAGQESAYSNEVFVAIPTRVNSALEISGVPGAVSDIPDPLILYAEYNPAVFSKYVFQLVATDNINLSPDLWPVIATVDSENCMSSSLANGNTGIWCFVPKTKPQEYFQFKLALRTTSPTRP